MRSETSREELFKVIRSVRRRWRLRVAMRGIAIVLGAGLLVLLASAYGMDRLRFTPQAILAFRIIAYAGLLGLVLRFLVWPLSRHAPDQRVALYLEEHEPSLELRLMSALEFARSQGDSTAGYSPALVRKLVESAAEQCRAIERGRRVERRPLARSSGLLAGTTLAALTLLLASPPFVRHSAPFLFPWGSADVTSPYSIAVEPGDARVARGSELKITARLVNFGSGEVEISVQRGVTGEWERFPMGLDDETGAFLFYLFDLETETEYFVEAGGVRSRL
ncbi:MAG TPA: hypothetical protein VLC48_06390, partial [Gemmatimonadota bacterium]|nr:hypothetical protein [Gemmatimonadota bacterium]